jgi:hypothetical protein
MWGTTKKEKERTGKERGDRRNRTSEKKDYSGSYGESTPRDSASHRDERSSRNDASRAANRAQYDNSELEESVSRLHIDSPEPNYTTTPQGSSAPISSSSGTYFSTPPYGEYAAISSSSALQYTTQYQATPISTPTYPTADTHISTYQYSSQSPESLSVLPTHSQTSGHAYPSYSQQVGQPSTFSSIYPPISGGSTYPSGQQAQSADADHSYDTPSPSNFPRTTSSSNDRHPPSLSTDQPMITARGNSTTTASYSSAYTSSKFLFLL